MINFRRKVIFMMIIMIIVFPLSLAKTADLTQEQWINFMINSLPAVFCNPSQYYRECFEVIQDECKDTVTFAVINCIVNNVIEIPATFDLKESRKWGSIIEKCVDQEYVDNHANQRIDNEYCNSIK